MPRGLDLLGEDRQVSQGLQGLVRTYNGKRGGHVALLYLAIGSFPFPFSRSFRVYRGQDTATLTQLAVMLLRQIPPAWRERFKIRVFADAGALSQKEDEDMKSLFLIYIHAAISKIGWIKEICPNYIIPIDILELSFANHRHRFIPF